MKSKWSLKLAISVDYFLHFFGTTALLITVLTLIVGRLDFWAGTACTIPGVVITEVLNNYILREGEKQMLAMRSKTQKELDEVADTEESDRREAECRFNMDGQCTYSEEPMACVRKEED